MSGRAAIPACAVRPSWHWRAIASDRATLVHRVRLVQGSAVPDVVRAMTDQELLDLPQSDGGSRAWGASGPVVIGGTQLFLKRVPLTDVEAARPRSTRNQFRLPTYYSYGFGSAGFGVWRELAAHEMTAGLDGFPTLIHHRVMPRSPPPGEPSISINGMGVEDYVVYWNKNAAVGRFIEARASASQEVWIFLEYIPHVAVTWLFENQDRIDDVLAQLFEIIATLRSIGVVHFDTHLGNIVTDGERCRLGDFGLAMAAAFELTAPERRFLERHHHYDYAVMLGHLGMMLAAKLRHRPQASLIAGSIDHLDEQGVRFRPTMVAAFQRYRDPIVYMANFAERIRRPAKRSIYDDREFEGLLRKTGVPL